MYQIGTLIIYLLTSLMALADSGLVDEVSCFDSLYKAKIANKKLLNGYIRLSHKVKNKHKGLYMVSHQDTFYCPLPSEASTQGRSYKSYDLKLQFHNDTKPILMTHTIQFDEVDLASTIGRIQRILASKTYKPVQCAQVKKNTQLARKILLKKLKQKIKTTPEKFKQLTQHDKELQKFPSEISEKMIRAMEACQLIPEMKNITQSSFKNIPQY